MKFHPVVRPARSMFVTSKYFACIVSLLESVFSPSSYHICSLGSLERNGALFCIKYYTKHVTLLQTEVQKLEHYRLIRCSDYVFASQEFPVIGWITWRNQIALVRRYHATAIDSPYSLKIVFVISK
jgi:hypothetical protein